MSRYSWPQLQYLIPCPCSHDLTVLSLLSCPGCPVCCLVHAVVFWPFCLLCSPQADLPGCHAPTILLRLFCPSCHSCPVPLFLSWLSCQGCPGPVVLPELFCPWCHVLVVLSSLSSQGWLVPADNSGWLSRPTCPGQPVQADLSRLSCPNCPDTPAFL